MQKPSTECMTAIRNLRKRLSRRDEISLDEVLAKKLGVIDLTATIMCLENKMPLVIFGLNEKDSIAATMDGRFNGTYVTV